jgi:hypothetical protein
MVIAEGVENQTATVYPARSHDLDSLRPQSLVTQTVVFLGHRHNDVLSQAKTLLGFPDTALNVASLSNCPTTLKADWTSWLIATMEHLSNVDFTNMVMTV